MKTHVAIGFLTGALLLSFSLFVTGCKPGPATGSAAIAKGQRYHCPMHPSYVADKPGNCPICGMKLVPMEETPAPAGDQKYGDRSVVAMSAEKRQLIGVRSEPVTSKPIAQRIRTVGRVAVDERRVHHVHTKYEGYVEHLHVDYVGKLVKRGEPLLSLYSPDLVATQQEYLLAYRAQARLASSAVPAAAQGSLDLYEAARQRLLFWDIRPADIARLEKTQEIRRTLDLHAEIDGYVAAKMAVHGMRVTPTDTLFDIADLSHLWVLADLYEHQLKAVRVGTEGHVSLSSDPGRQWSGKVTYISPTVEERTRTIKARLEVDNVGRELKPDMYADVFFDVDLGQGLVVPDSAVVNAGDRRLVFLDRGDGTFEPREVRLGVKVNGSDLQVVSGVAEGDLVVTSANFLLDSESSLKAAIGAMKADADGATPPTAPAEQDHRRHQR
jgi:RND family efflux transporter MFP subunit